MIGGPPACQPCSSSLDADLMNMVFSFRPGGTPLRRVSN
nr:MAG TPA: hypothetical protein [Caudoviricetes sp.]